MKTINVELIEGEYSFSYMTSEGFKPVFADTQEDIEAKAREHFGNNVVITIEDLDI